jgi:hypothetical protein
MIGQRRLSAKPDAVCARTQDGWPCAGTWPGSGNVAPSSVRFSNTLDGSYFEQLASERLITKFSRGRPVKMFEVIPRAQRDVGYPRGQYGVRQGLAINLTMCEAALRLERAKHAAAEGNAKPLARKALKVPYPTQVLFGGRCFGRELGLFIMIYIIGTWHQFQMWSDAIRNGETIVPRKEHVEAFEIYLTDVARSLKADMIAEEESADRVAAFGSGSSSVATVVAKQLGKQHLFCNPTEKQYPELGLKCGSEMLAHVTILSGQTGCEFADVHAEEVRKQFAVREDFWLECLQSHEPNNKTIIFVCGADHVDSFKTGLGAKGILACILCREWTPQA